jgi:hypothetical protein
MPLFANGVEEGCSRNFGAWTAMKGLIVSLLLRREGEEHRREGQYEPYTHEDKR